MAFEIKKNPKKWIVAGTGSGWELMPKESSSIIFCLNDFIRVENYGVKMDYLAIMDILDEKPQIVSGKDNLGEVVKRINDLKVPLICPYKYEEIPLSEPFPLEECRKVFGLPYFSNTIGYMIAYALLKGAEEISIYGVNQASSGEYTMEKAGVEYWLGIAVGRGVKITINGDKSELLTNKQRWGAGMLYGYNLNYDQIMDNNLRFGSNIIKSLFISTKNKQQTVRKIN